MSSEIRNVRLANDYQEMCNMRGKLLDWKVLKGVPPHVEEYELYINLKSAIDTSSNFRTTHIVKVILPPAYPKKVPNIFMLSVPKIAHPNWYQDGRWCNGSYNLRESLGTLVRRMMATIQFDPNFANPDSAADSTVLTWYKRQLSLGMLPFDNTQLPDPKGSKLIIKKRTFKVKR